MDAVVVAAAHLTPSQAISSQNGLPPPSNSTSNQNNNAQGQSRTGNNNNGNNNNKSKRRQRNRGNKSSKKNNKNEAGAGQQEESGKGVGGENGLVSGDNKNNNDTKPEGNNNNKKKKRNRNRKKKNADNNNNAAAAEGSDQNEQQAQQQTNNNNNNNNKKKGKQQNNNNNNNKNKNRNRNNGRKKRYPWRRYIPAGSSDPITLDALVSLPYPPFALVATEPYIPVDWPTPEMLQQTATENKNKNNNKKTQQQQAEDVTTTEQHQQQEQNEQQQQQETDEQRQKRIIEEQWGNSITIKDNIEDKKSNIEDKKTDIPEKRHYHLYDGKALAYYLVSQLQFIDPLNRRDLTRDELVHLNQYLRQHGLLNNDVNVVEAYDAKGVSLSTAGAVGNTAAGRMEIMQQEAQNLLNALFGGGPTWGGSSGGNTSNTNANASLSPSATPYLPTQQENPLQAQYAAYQQQQQQSQQNRQRNRNRNNRQQRNDEGDVGIYGDDAGGLVVIDDDANPGLRGRAIQSSQPNNNNNTNNAPGFGAPNTLWSASHIASQYSHAATTREENFPALQASPAPAPSSTTTTNSVQPKQQQPKPASSSLKFIKKAIKKTTPEETQRQWEAREEARRKAMLSNLTFGSNPASWDQNQFMMGGDYQQRPITIAAAQLPPSDAKLDRNRAFAEALGVAPATVRGNNNNAVNSYKAGWARPVHTAESSASNNTAVRLDEFGDELNACIYPESLIMQAREHMGLLLKVEKKWKAFLLDDTSASLPLNPMNRPSRAFVHQYSDFWRLHTESFDQEPRRYIHCVKLLDTAAPYPLLSDAARNYKYWQQRPQVVDLSSLPTAPRASTSTAAVVTTNVIGSDHTLQQTAGQVTRGKIREIPPPPERTPLPLKPRSVERSLLLDTTTTTDATEVVVPTNNDNEPNTRFDALFEGRERPKLDLQRRTKPLELPPFQSEKSIVEDTQRRRAKLEQKERRRQEEEQRKARMLEAAFASDDDEDGGSGGNNDDDDSEWEQGEEIFPGSDSE